MKLGLELDHVGIPFGSPRALLEDVERSVRGAFADGAQLVGLEPQRRQSSASVVFFSTPPGRSATSVPA